MRKRTKTELTIGILGIVLLSAVWVGSRLWAGNKNIYTSLETFQRVLQITRDSYVRDVELDSMIEDAMNGMLQELDPYSMYMSPKSYENLNINMQGEFGGLGITIGMTDGWLTVISPLEGTPADSVGLLAGDWIVEIEGESTEGISTDEAVVKLRGEPGTKVTIKVQRTGIDDPIEFTIVRDLIKLNAVSYSGKLSDEVGYVRFSKFSRTAREEVEDAIDSLFEKEGVTKLVLDIRGNSGGLLSEGVDLTDLFLDRDREIVQTRGRVPQSFRTYRSHEEPIFGDYPLVVLTDRGSASAAEILAGALQDWERALIVGDTSFGKGSVQTIHTLPDSGRLKLTTAYWYTPSGRCIDMHRAKMDEEAGLESPSYSTLGKAKRTLFGGGAIVPDVYVGDDESDEARQLTWMFQIERVFFAYTVEYLSGNPGIEMDFSVTDEMLADLKTEALDREVEFTEEEFTEAAELIKYYLRLEIATQKWGQGGRYSVILADDPVVDKAVELLESVETSDKLLGYAGG